MTWRNGGSKHEGNFVNINRGEGTGKMEGRRAWGMVPKHLHRASPRKRNASISVSLGSYEA